MNLLWLFHRWEQSMPQSVRSYPTNLMGMVIDPDTMGSTNASLSVETPGPVVSIGAEQMVDSGESGPAARRRLSQDIDKQIIRLSVLDASSVRLQRAKEMRYLMGRFRLAMTYDEVGNPISYAFLLPSRAKMLHIRVNEPDEPELPEEKDAAIEPPDSPIEFMTQLMDDSIRPLSGPQAYRAYVAKRNELVALVQE